MEQSTVSCVDAEGFLATGDRFPVSQEALERALWRVFERTLEPYQKAEDIPDSHLRDLMLPGCLTLASAIILSFSTPRMVSSSLSLRVHVFQACGCCPWKMEVRIRIEVLSRQLHGTRAQSRQRL
jgi:hypothetical protein